MENFPTFTNDLKEQLKWLEENKIKDEKISGIKQQKFLLFYNLFLKASNKNANFTGLCAWKGGPVYTQVHAAIKHHYSIAQIINSIDEEVNIDQTLANISKFIVELLSDEEVSEITHKFDFWKTIDNNYEKNEITQDTITKQDEEKILKLLNFYDIDFINKHKIYKTENATFFLENKDYDYILKNLKSELEKFQNDRPIKINLESKHIKLQKEYDKITI